tara:strand:+ start:284 stop:604 length:321 start_codon:yes stop_codon:yes gene_type:complete
MRFKDRNYNQTNFTKNEIVVTFKKPVTLRGFGGGQKTTSVNYDKNIIGEKFSNLKEFVMDSLDIVEDEVRGIDSFVKLDDYDYETKQWNRKTLSENIEKIEIVITQ